MPELPEVETTLKGIKPHVLGKTITQVIVRHPRLRWDIPPKLAETLKNKKVLQLTRRAKYILFKFNHGTLILHLGMSGSLRVLQKPVVPKKHDHVDILFGKTCLRFTDPRRFGALLWTEDAVEKHPLLKNIGPEPLSADFNGDYLWQKARRRKSCVKIFIMDSKIVAGVGNIYATEALFAAQINPRKAAGKVTQAQYQHLAAAIKAVINSAIKKGGTTLRDFSQSDGTPGYFSLELKAYGNAKKPCPRYHTPLKTIRIAQRATVYCGKCQK